MSVKRWWREKLNLDGPWWCIGCGTRTVVRNEANESVCVRCFKRQCSCEIGGWSGPGWTDPKCEHHGPDPAILAAEAKAMALSRHR